MIFWAVWIVVGTAYELWAVFTHKDKLTLTHFLLVHVPRWLLAMGLGWVTYHFLIQNIPI